MGKAWYMLGRSNTGGRGCGSREWDWILRDWNLRAWNLRACGDSVELRELVWKDILEGMNVHIKRYGSCEIALFWGMNNEKTLLLSLLAFQDPCRLLCIGLTL